jgi:uncharacterized protein (DUF952 family)
MSTNWVYKIMTAEQWARLEADGVWSGSEVDLRDGFVHLSAWGQVLGTLEKHFSPQKGLLLVGLPVERVRPDLRWEVSRGGQEFPHLYRELRVGDVFNRRPIDWVDGQPRIGEILPGGGQLELGYPLYLLHHGPGYVSLVDIESTDEPQPQALAVFGSYERAVDFVEQMAGLAGIRAIKNAREFQWLLTSLTEPVVEAVLDPAIDRPEIVGVWRRRVTELLARDIEIDNSPWNYPVYLLKSRGEKSGWSSIQAGGGSHWFSFMVMFTGKKLANAYQREIESEDGMSELISVPDMWRLREHLLELGTEIAGVAINPTVEAGVRKSAQCLEIGRLLEHYLLVVRPPGSEI